jgi:hypothetical protein
MYTKVDLLQLPKPDITVIGDTSGIHTIALLARVLKARDPLITNPPAESVVWQRAGDIDIGAELMRAMHAAANDPFFLRLRTGQDPVKPPAIDTIYQPYLLAAMNLGVNSLLSFPRVYLSTVPDMADALNKLSQPEGHVLGDGSLPIAAMIEQDPLREPFAQVALTMNYERLIKSKIFDRLDPTEVQTDKGPSATTQRGLLMATMMRILAMQTPLLRIRPLLRFLRMPQSQVRMREELMAHELEHWESLIDRILQHPVHPWIAKAEEASLPATRMTPWGDASPTILLEREFLKSKWDGSGAPGPAERAAFTRDMNTRLDAPLLLEKMVPTIKALREYLIDIEDGGRGQKITTVLGFTLPSAPTQIPLWGGAFHPIHFDGLNTNEPVNDLVAASYGIHLPARTPKAAPWIGEEAIVNYTGNSRMDGDGAPWGAYVGTINVAPEDIIVDASFHTKRFTPSMLKYISDGYQGDLTAYIFNPTPREVGAVFGLSEAQVRADVATNPSQWRHIFSVEETKGTTELKAVKDEPLFYSEKTRMPWLKEVTLPRLGVPTVLWGMRRGLADTCLGVAARFIRDPQIPLPSIPLTGAVDKLVTLALSAQLAGVMK